MLRLTLSVVGEHIVPALRCPDLEQSEFRMTLKNGFGKRSLLALSAYG